MELGAVRGAVRAPDARCSLRGVARARGRRAHPECAWAADATHAVYPGAGCGVRSGVLERRHHCSGREHSFGAPTHPVFLNTTLSKETRLEHRAAAGRRRRGGDGGDKGTLSRRLRTICIILVKPPGAGGIRSHLLTPRRPLAPAPNARAAGSLSRTAPRQPPHVRAGAGVRTQWRWALGKPKGLGRGRKMTCRHGGRAWSRGVYFKFKLLFIPS